MIHFEKRIKKSVPTCWQATFALDDFEAVASNFPPTERVTLADSVEVETLSETRVRRLALV